ncbi:MAG: UxaA family hydrolase [[Clostridium] innocuum]
MRFRGYRRNDGRIGIRNHVLISLPVCAAKVGVAHQVMMQVQGAVSFHNQGWAGLAKHRSIKEMYAADNGRDGCYNPNVYWNHHHIAWL